MKTYIAQIINPHGNGYAIVNASNPKSVEDIIRNQSRFHNSIVASCRELVWKDADDSIIYEGAIMTLGKSAYDLAVLMGYKGTLEEWLSSMKGKDGDVGVGVSAIILNPDNSLTFTLTNGTTITTDGIHIEGEGGSGGQDGVGIQSIQTIQSTQESGGTNIIRITLTNGNTFDFNVYNGAKGDGNDGITPTITASASVDNTTGTPSVTVTKTGDDAHPSFAFSFSGIKGESGSSSGGEANIIEEIQLNGTKINPVGKVVNINLSAYALNTTLQGYIQKAAQGTTGLLKPDGTIDNNTYLTQHQDISGKVNTSDLSNVAFSGDYDDLDNKPTIPAAGDVNVIEEVQVNGVALVPDSNKAVNVQVPTNNNQLTNGAGYITSADIAGKEDKVAIITPELDNNNAFNATVGNYYKVTGNASAIDITLVTPSDTSHLSSCIFLIDNSNGVGASFHTQNLPFYQAANFAIATGKVYEVNALFNGTAWYLTQVEMEVQP